jgi:hypothetical protein
VPDVRARNVTCAERFRVMAFAQPTWRESLRDGEVVLSANHPGSTAWGSQRGCDVPDWPMPTRRGTGASGRTSQPPGDETADSGQMLADVQRVCCDRCAATPDRARGNAWLSRRAVQPWINGHGASESARYFDTGTGHKRAARASRNPYGFSSLVDGNGIPHDAKFRVAAEFAEATQMRQSTQRN